MLTCTWRRLLRLVGVSASVQPCRIGDAGMTFAAAAASDKRFRTKVERDRDELQGDQITRKNMRGPRTSAVGGQGTETTNSEMEKPNLPTTPANEERLVVPAHVGADGHISAEKTSSHEDDHLRQTPQPQWISVANPVPPMWAAPHALHAPLWAFFQGCGALFDKLLPRDEETLAQVACWVCGALVSLASSLAFTFGLIALKVAKEEAKDFLLWYAAVGSCVVGVLITPLILVFVPLISSLIACLVPTTLLLTSVLAPAMLDEEFTNIHVCSGLLICVASVAAALSGCSGEEDITDPNDLLHKLGSPGFLLLLAVLFRLLAPDARVVWQRMIRPCFFSCETQEEAGDAAARKDSLNFRSRNGQNQDGDGALAASSQHEDDQHEAHQPSEHLNQLPAPDPISSSEDGGTETGDLRQYPLLLLACSCGVLALLGGKSLDALQRYDRRSDFNSQWSHLDLHLPDGTVSQVSDSLALAGPARVLPLFLAAQVAICAGFATATLSLSVTHFHAGTTFTLSCGFGLVSQVVIAVVFFREYSSVATLASKAAGAGLGLLGIYVLSFLPKPPQKKQLRCQST